MLALNTTASLAQDVELFTLDGSMSVRGQLIDFIDQTYTIDSSIGRLTLSSAFARASTVVLGGGCSGTSCRAGWHAAIV